MNSENFSSSCDINVNTQIAAKNSKKKNFRQRIRSMREECEEGPLLASGEDLLPDIDDGSGFVVASRGKRERKTRVSVSEEDMIDSCFNQSLSKASKDFHSCLLNTGRGDQPKLTSENTSRIDYDEDLVEGCHDQLEQNRKFAFPKNLNVSPEVSSSNQSVVNRDLTVFRSSFDSTCSPSFLECLRIRYPNLNEVEFQMLVQLARKQVPEFSNLLPDEIYEKLEMLRDNNCKGKIRNVETLPPKPAWNQVRACSTTRVLDFNECAVCLLPWVANEKIILEECGHCFHPLCLRTWMKEKRTCPFCSTFSLSPDDFPRLT